MNNQFFFNIDVLGSCNLSCPSCPVGNFKSANPRGFMAPELLDEILKKATNECSISGVGLFNWTEPLLHPQIAELVRIVNSYNLDCFLSSNLNIIKNLKDVLQENPHSLRISVSGYNQSIYVQNHRGGNIEKVKENMIAVAEAKSITNSTTEIHVLYHRYLGNLDDELLMRKFTNDLGFAFMPVWAFMMPLEKVLAYVDDDYNEEVITQEDLEVINRLALPLKESLEAVQGYKNQPCRLRSAEMTLDFMGNVQLCCAVYDAQKYTLKPFLEAPLEELQDMKYSNSLCTKCMDKGYHIYAVYGGSGELDRIAIDNLSKYYSQYLLGADSISVDSTKPTLEGLNLRAINLIVFPDWLQPEETVGSELQEILKYLVMDVNKSKMTLLIDHSNISAEEANLMLSSVAMNLLMEEELEVDEGPEIVLVDQLSQREWSALIPQLKGRIKLESENEEAIASKAQGIPTIDLRVSSSNAV